MPTGIEMSLSSLKKYYEILLIYEAYFCVYFLTMASYSALLLFIRLAASTFSG